MFREFWQAGANSTDEVGKNEEIDKWKKINKVVCASSFLHAVHKVCIIKKINI